MIYKALRTLYSLALMYWREKTSPTVSTKNSKPSVINLNANDICNSKCTMCNIWKNKQDYEMSPNDLQDVFHDSFFSEVTHVGITGGEPTLREDLVDLFKSCIENLPKLKGVSIITNAIKEEQVKEQLQKISELCHKYKVNFSVMVSLDGFNSTHDLIRGRKGNFTSAINVINFVNTELKRPLSFGATISKENVWEIDELLDYAIRHNLYGRFRVAEYIKRLYNDERTEVIRNFTEDENYHLALFFEKLKKTYEKEFIFQRTYSSIQNILLGGKRTIGCPYHRDGILLNSKGDIAYCAPKSKIIGNALKEKASKIYANNLSEKKRLIKEDCDNCIHDYHAPITFNEKINLFKASLERRFLTVLKQKEISRISSFLPTPKIDKSKYTIFIVGWYGTETVGDKAILGGTINHYKEKYNNKLNIIVGSLYPFISDRTIKELNIDAQIVSTRNFNFLRFSKVCDEIIMGGGPLMDLAELYVPLLSFTIAKKYNKKCTVFGCGLGPITVPMYKKAIEKILRLSDTIKLRDHKSIAYADKEFNISPERIEMFGDPAKPYVQSRSPLFSDKKEKVVISLFLRDWEFGYGKTRYTEDEFEKQKQLFEQGLANLIRQKADELNADQVIFNNMHNFVIGGDDRDFSRRFIREHFADDTRITYDKKLATVDSTIEVMKSSTLNICMRFHSVLFAHTLDTNFLAVDYTLGGKIEAYLTQNDALDHILTVDNVIKKFANENSTH